MTQVEKDVAEIARLLVQIHARVDSLERSGQVLCRALARLKSDMDALGDEVVDHRYRLADDDRVFTLLVAGGGLGQ